MRELLSKGDQSFKITKFALSDEGVDYRMYDTNHASGSNFYAQEIEAMPLLEPVVDESLVMKYKLVTLPKGTTKIPTVKVTPSALALDYKQESIITPSTTTFIAGFDNSQFGYTCVLSNSDLATLEVDQLAANQKSLGTIPSWLDDSALRKSAFAVGRTFKVIAKDVTALSSADRAGTITVIGNETGGQADLIITVAPPTGSIV